MYGRKRSTRAIRGRPGRTRDTHTSLTPCRLGVLSALEFTGAPGLEPSAAVRLGELMQRHRDRRGLSQRKLDELLSLERSNLSQFETGARIPPPDVMTSWYAVMGRDAEVERLYLAALGQRGLDRRARRGASRTRPGRPRLTAAPVEVARLDDGPSAEPDATAPTLAATDMTSARPSTCCGRSRRPTLRLRRLSASTVRWTGCAARIPAAHQVKYARRRGDCC